MTNTYCAPSLGIDIVKISELSYRISAISSVSAVFTESELRGNISFSLISQYQHLAGIFAAKEAFMKAYGKKVDWKDIWVEKNEQGKPVLYSSLLSPDDIVKVSISHDGDYAVAVVMIIFKSTGLTA